MDPRGLQARSPSDRQYVERVHEQPRQRPCLLQFYFESPSVRTRDLPRLLHDGAEDIVSPQFKVNDTFIPAVIKYLVETDVESLEGTSYILFTRLFDNNSHAQYVDNELLKRLFDSLSFLKR